MEPISMSLLAISSCGLAACRSVRDDGVIDFPAHRVDASPRTSVLATLAAGLKKRKLFAPGQSDMLHALARFAASQGLRIDMQVSLSALFDDDEDRDVASALRQRRVDVVISDMDGTPLCGVELPAGRGPAYRDAVRRMAFDGAKLPLLTLHDYADWNVCRCQLVNALRLDDDPVNDPQEEGSVEAA
ncbi:Protein of unknown function [Jannaschia faecimaris]|uniref:Uncharacterized protein n=1 Tax=Jannaschia faecimaris TaxID=1244108 RepID=A0A1H3LIW9_9RHOB|nr:DUF2726 domain-containing protein [Jannaschia faecimaris]SDY63894.1 Protein of unknown function [Jannaschia faecimaris]